MVALLVAPCGIRAEPAPPWLRYPSTHFIIHYAGDDTALARTVSEKAEAYYTDIAADLGYTRYQKFWLWDNRVNILIYPTAEAFTRGCQAPAWAVGRASFERHEIAGYRQSSEAFINSLLPHEMSHLILADFIGRDHIPLWLTEGFAQWEQLRQPGIPPLPPNPFKLSELMVMDIRSERDTTRVALFYRQSASLVGFLIHSRGGTAFGVLCRSLRDGKTFEAALAAAYPGDLGSLEVLEKKWLASHSP